MGGMGSADYTLDALLNIASLRHVGCTLPVELWHNSDSRLTFSAERARLLESMGNVFIRAVGSNLGGYQYVGHVLTHSRFDEILYIDADNVAIGDPTPLFLTQQYINTGAIFWPDFTTLNMNAALWDIIGQKPLPMMSLETGQMLINRRKHWRALTLAKYFIDRGPEFYFDLSLGDNELFLFSWLALSAPFYLVDVPVSSAGYIGDGGVFCGHTMLQFHPNLHGETIFAHRNLMKWNLFPGDEEMRWTAIKRGQNLTKEKMYRAPHGYSKGFSDTKWIVSDKCMCTDGRSEGCVDLDRQVDHSDSSKRTLVKLAAIEKEILMLRRRLVHGNGEMFGEWQLAWLGKISNVKYDLNESSHSDVGTSASSLEAEILHPEEL